MKNFVSKGETLTLTAPTGGVVSGSAYLIGAIAVVAHESAAEGAHFVGHTCGVFNLPTTGTPTEGQAAYITTANEITATVGSNVKIGAFVSPKVDGNCDVWFTGQA